MKFSNKLILFFIVIVAAVLRFYNLFEIPYTHDEFSAIYRTHFSSFPELIEKGVIADTIPAGVQVFLFYWIKLFGDTEWVVKLPFILFGIFSVYMIFLVSKKWSNETVALIAAAFLASLQYTVFYSQVARPYISGMFFVLLMVNAWTDLMKTPERRFLLNGIVFILSAAICAYNHHFSLLFAAIVGISGLFLIGKKYLVRYIVCCVLAMVLYIPHINIILCQLKMGGNEGWMGKMTGDFLVKYLAYIFQFSAPVYLLVIFLIVFGFKKLKRREIKFNQLILFFCWFIFPFLIGFLYSRYVNNVMQFSVLIFGFPFLLFVLFGHIKAQKTWVNLLLVWLILSVNTYALVVERKHYKLFYNSAYEKVLTDHQSAMKTHKMMSSLIDADKVISEYYIKKLNLDTCFTWYSSLLDESDLVTYLKNQSLTSDYLYFGCLSGNNPLTVSVIQDYFPTIEKQNNYFDGTTYIFSKAEPEENDFIEYNDFETMADMCVIETAKRKFTDTACFSGRWSYVIDTGEYSETYTRQLCEIMQNKNNFIDISLKALLPEKVTEANIVAVVLDKDSVYYWTGTAFEKFRENRSAKDGWVTIHHSVKLSDMNTINKKMVLKVYIWNKSRDTIMVDDFAIKLRQGNSVIYSLFQKF